MLEGRKWEHVDILSTGSVYPVKTGNQTLGYAFFYQVGDEDKKRKVVTGNSEKELEEKAVRFLDKINAECEDKLHRADEEYRESIRPKTFSEVSMEWFMNYSKLEESGKLSYSSVSSRGYSVTAINKVIGDKLIAEIGNEDAKDLLQKCSVKENGTYFSRSKLDKIQQAFLMVMRYGKEKGYCERVPDKMELDDNLTEVDKESRFLDERQLKIIFGIIDGNPRYKTVINLLMATGLRQEEAFALNVDDFKVLPDGNVEINIAKTVVEGHDGYEIVNSTKTKQSKRKVYIPNNIYQMVMDYYNDTIQNATRKQKVLRAENGLEGYIFLNKDMRPINKRTFQHNLKDYLKNNGGEEFDFKATLHMLRHTYVSHMADCLTLDKVALLIGDSIATTHGMYQSLTSDTKQAVCENVGQFMNKFSDRQ